MQKVDSYIGIGLGVLAGLLFSLSITAGLAGIVGIATAVLWDKGYLF